MKPIIVDSVYKRYGLGIPNFLVMAITRLTRRGHRWLQDEFWALQDVSFEMEPGEVLGLIGANGAGKSTMLKLLSGVSYPTKGRIEVNGRVSPLIQVGAGFGPELTGRENIYLNGIILGMTKREIDRKLDDIIAFSGLEEFIDTPVKKYSSGMYVRLGFSVAVHIEPEILLVDEVLAVGDYSFRNKSYRKMLEIRDSGATIVFVSHNMAAIQTMCDRAIWLDRGRVRMQGQPAPVIEAYLDAQDAKQSDDHDMVKNDSLCIGPIEVEKVELRSRGIINPPLVYTGDSLIVRIGYRAQTSVDNAHLRLHVLSARHGGLLDVSSAFTHSHAPRLDGTGVAECEISDLPLVEGDYHLELDLIGQGGMLLGERQRIAHFHVETPWHDLGFAGKDAIAWSRRVGLVFARYQWRFLTSEDVRQDGRT